MVASTATYGAKIGPMNGTEATKKVIAAPMAIPTVILVFSFKNLTISLTMIFPIAMISFPIFFVTVQIS